MCTASFLVVAGFLVDGSFSAVVSRPSVVVGASDSVVVSAVVDVVEV